MNNAKKEDIRIIRTHKALYCSLPKLLMKRGLSHITVHDLCIDAQLSRTAFYAHFCDKYDLLQAWLKHIKPEIKIGSSYPAYEESINAFIGKHRRLIKNLLEDATTEVLELVKDFIIEVLGIPSPDSAPSDRQTVLYNFCAGGVMECLLWQIKNRFPKDVPFFNNHFYDALSLLRQLEQ